MLNRTYGSAVTRTDAPGDGFAEVTDGEVFAQGPVLVASGLHCGEGRGGIWG